MHDVARTHGQGQVVALDADEVHTRAAKRRTIQLAGHESGKDVVAQRLKVILDLHDGRP
jgi:hypothetical protein